MIRSVYKYGFDIADEQTVCMPEGAVLRHVGTDGFGDPALWVEIALYDDRTLARPMRDYQVYVVGTGHPLPTPKRPIAHAGTFVQGALVWHIYVDARMVP